MLYKQYEQENQEWISFTKQKFGQQIEMLSISESSGNYRIYQHKNKIVKIHRIKTEFYKRTQNLAGEYKFLSHINDILKINNLQFSQESKWEWIILDYIPGKTLGIFLKESTVPVKILTFLKILRLIILINFRGIAHRDIRFDNIIIDNNGRAHLIDFDQAIETNPISAMFIDIFGLKINKIKGFYSFNTLLKIVIVNRFIPRDLLVFVKKLFSLNKKPQIPLPVPINIINNNPDLIKLNQAWQKGAQSNASSPGVGINYYNFNVADCHFPGERPWELRWRNISENINFKGKRVLELGCNLGLLSAFAHLAGASECVGVDKDSDILEGACLVSEAFHVKNRFCLIDFDSSEIWEKKVNGFDLVIALSVVNWLKNRKRFLKFLGQHNELLYEGHDPIDVEITRLRAVGFNRFKKILISERNRAIILAYKFK